MDLNEALGRSELFRGVLEADRARVAALARLCAFEDRAPVVREDEEAQDLFLIVEGRGEVEVKWPFSEGESQQIGIVRQGDLIGEVTLVDRCLRSATVRAVGPVKAVAIPHEGLRRLLEENPALGYRVMENVARLLAGRIRETNLKLRNTIANLLY
jgi:CRP/FNR family cyclic AMP-dependent transcriptional regulator